MNDQKTKILNLEQIASWWLKEVNVESGVTAALPSLQRGFVWKTSQVERLWDSIVQGFPISSLLLSPYDPNQQIVDGKVATILVNDMRKTITHMLLDGQQRTTAIALGFRNIWDIDNTQDDSDPPTQALWVDLKPLDNDERQYAFRMVTKAHPWGYKKNDPDKRLSAVDARDAQVQFCKKQNTDIEQKKKLRLDELHLKYAYPADAVAPLPLAMIIGVITKYKNDKQDIHEHKDDKEKNSNKEILKDLKDQLNLQKFNCSDKQKIAVENCLNGTSEYDAINLINKIRSALDSLEIPAVIIEISKKNNVKSDYDGHDPTFNLFKRINSGGTTLSREEINYSLLKSVWREARTVIEDTILNKRKIAQPAKMASLMIRLFMMSEKKEEGTVDKLQPELSIGQLRKKLHGTDKEKLHGIDKDWKNNLVEFCEKKGPDIVQYVWELLAYKSKDTDSKNVNDYRLPSVLASKITKDAGDLMLLIMFWVCRLPSIDSLNEEQRKMTVGFITAVSWFSPNQSECVKELMQMLVDVEDEDLYGFFNSDRYSKIINPTERGKIRAIPLLPPRLLRDSLKSTIDDKEAKSLWDLYGGEKIPLNIFGDLEKYNKEKIGDSDGQWTRDVWWYFLDRVYRYKRFVLYAQRKYIQEWYEWFDPTQPDQVAEHNRPWDYDHILPRSWTHYDTKMKSNIPSRVRVWVNSNGNFRAWPLESNRSKGNDSILEPSLVEYGLKDEKAVKEASFIDKNSIQWVELIENNENKKDFLSSKKAMNEFVELAIYRTIAIYEEWYKQLEIEKLMK